MAAMNDQNGQSITDQEQDQERTQQEAEAQDGLQDRAIAEAGQGSPAEETGDCAEAADEFTDECMDQLDTSTNETSAEADAVVEPAPAEGKGPVPAEEADSGPEGSSPVTPSD